MDLQKASIEELETVLAKKKADELNAEIAPLEERVEKALEAKDKADAEYSSAVTELLEAQAKAFFAKYGWLESFGWTQYTPYFNDGAVCVFSANIDYPSINGQYEGYGISDEIDGVSEDEVEEAYEEIADFLVKTFDDDLLLDIFGDHKDIVVTRNGVNVSDYNHHG